jgi:hypothetical protein
MSDEEFQAKLKQARSEAQQFFADWSFAPLREKVHNRIRSQPQNKPLRWPSWLVGQKHLIAAATLVVLTAAIGLRLTHQLPWSSRSSILGPSEPIAEYSINLKDGAEHRLSFFPIVRPDWQEQKLLAVIWERNPVAPGYLPLYSSVLGGVGNPEPALTVKLPGSHNPWALISSRNPDMTFLHYRAIGFDGAQLTSYWQQDFVPGGELEVQSGVIIERRQAVPVNSTTTLSSENIGTNRVHFLIPYQISSDRLLLPVEHLQIKTGEYLTFIGAQNKVQTHVQGTALKQLEAKEDTPQFYAAERGQSVILLEPENKQIARQQLIISVAE